MFKRSIWNKQVMAWALYDWANSAFATVVLAGFFPLFFKQYWSVDTPATTSTFQLGLGNSVASVVILILAPVVGAIADAGQLRKRFLLLFASLGILMTACMYFVGQGDWQWALLLFVLSVIGFSGSVTFSDSLIVCVAEEKDFDLVSALGYALGYLGGGLLFTLGVIMTLWPEYFGFSDSAEAVQFSFVTVAIWWAVFSLPLMRYVHEGKRRPVAVFDAVRGGMRQLKNTFRQVRQLKVVFIFLLAYWLYIDGVDTIVRMAVDYGMSIGLNANDLIIALLITQFVGFPAALLFGLLGEKLGAKTGILIAIGVYFGVTIWAYHMQTTTEFYILAIIIGLVQGGIQSLSRSFYARIIPANKSAEFFGFYNMMGKFAAVIGPIMMGSVAVLLDSPRLGILSVSILFLIGGILLLLVNEEQGKRAARSLAQQ